MVCVAFPEDVPHQEEVGQEAEAESAYSSLDSDAHRQHNQVSNLFLLFRFSTIANFLMDLLCLGDAGVGDWRRSFSLGTVGPDVRDSSADTMPSAGIGAGPSLASRRSPANPVFTFPVGEGVR